MVRSMFAGVAGLRAHQTKMDVIGNNIANVNTYGFKTGRATFKDSFYQTLSGSNGAGVELGGGNAMQIGYGSQISSINILHTRGAFGQTDSPTDVMINGTGFFMVGPKVNEGYPADGTTEDNRNITNLSLTRVGIFEFDGAGNLVDPNRNIVYGFLPDAAGGGGGGGTTTPTFDTKTVKPIVLPKDAAGVTMKFKEIQIAGDGSITGVDDAGNVVSIAQLAVANVPNPSGLEMTQSSYFKAKDNTGLVTAYGPGTGTTGQLISGGLEMANVDLSREFTEMITTQRGFQANTRIITVTDEMLQELVNLKR